MASGRNTYGTRNSPANGRLIRLLDGLMLILTVVAGAMLLFAYLSRYVNPNTVWWIAFCGLAAPILYIINIVTALYWVVRWKMFVFIPAVILVIGIGWVSLFFRPSISKHYDPHTSRTTVVMTYNVMGFIFDNPDISSIDSITSLVRTIDPDILCLQEYQAVTPGRKARIDSLINMPYNRVHYKIENQSGGGWGLAVYSKYPISGTGSIDYENSTNSSMWVDIVAGTDTVRVFNNHLQTTSVTSSDIDYINNHEFLVPGSDAEERVRSIVSKLKRNFNVRAEQVDTLAPVIHDSPYKTIVCGDFNDTPMSYAYHRIRGGLKDSFVEKGRGMPHTFKGLFNIFRIDYIMHSREMNTVSYSTPDHDYSDHKPVVAGIELNP